MRKTIFASILVVAWTTLINPDHILAQLPNGSTAPDFTATDINGNSHNLYGLLDEGKTVVLDFYATWCEPCWDDHQAHYLKDIWEQYGPDGTDEFYVLSIESDTSTGMNELNGIGQDTHGDWITGTPYPMIDLSSSAISDDYSVGFFPTYYVICPDKTVNVVNSPSVSGIYSTNCATISSIDEQEAFKLRVYPNPTSDYIAVDIPSGFTNDITLSMNDMVGKQVLTESISPDKNTHQLSVSDLAAGTYILTLSNGNTTAQTRISINR